MRNRTSDLRILTLSHKDSMVSKAHYEVRRRKISINFGNFGVFKYFHESVTYARVPVQNNIISKFLSANVELFNTQEDVTFISQLISLAGNAFFLKETVFK